MDLVDISQSSADVQLGTLPEPGQNEANHTVTSSDLFNDEEPDQELEEFRRTIAALFERQNIISNAKALLSRFFQLVRRPELGAPLTLDIYSHSMSVFTSGRQSGVDFLYPMSSLMKRRSGRLGRLILDYSRDLQQRNIHETASSQEDFDFPRVAVIDLNEVSRDVIETGYSTPTDMHGFLIILIVHQTLISLGFYIFAAPDAGPVRDWLESLAYRWFHEWLGDWISYLVGLGFVILINWSAWFMGVSLFCAYAILRGNGDLTLVRNTSSSASGYAVFLDRDFSVILAGGQSVIEAIAVGSFNISHPISWKFHRKALQLGQRLCYEIFESFSRGIFFALFVGCWLFFRPSSFLSAWVALVPVIIASGLPLPTGVQELVACILSRPRHRLNRGVVKRLCTGFVRYMGGFLPSSWLLLAYELQVAKEPLFTSMSSTTSMLQWAPLISFTIFLISSQDFHIRTEKFLDILGNPTVRRWEFRTLAAAATFQCLVLFRNIPRPIKTVDVLGLLDVFIPDQTDVWKVWKKRVADRITHEEENNLTFAPTLPIFGDQRQERLKEYLDEAQTAYDAYKRFYDTHVPLYAVESL